MKESDITGSNSFEQIKQNLTRFFQKIGLPKNYHDRVFLYLDEDKKERLQKVIPEISKGCNGLLTAMSFDSEEMLLADFLGLSEDEWLQIIKQNILSFFGKCGFTDEQSKLVLRSIRGDVEKIEFFTRLSNAYIDNTKVLKIRDSNIVYDSQNYLLKEAGIAPEESPARTYDPETAVPYTPPAPSTYESNGNGRYATPQVAVPGSVPQILTKSEGTITQEDPRHLERRFTRQDASNIVEAIIKNPRDTLYNVLTGKVIDPVKDTNEQIANYRKILAQQVEYFLTVLNKNTSSTFTETTFNGQVIIWQDKNRSKFTNPNDSQINNWFRYSHKHKEGDVYRHEEITTRIYLHPKIEHWYKVWMDIITELEKSELIKENGYQSKVPNFFGRARNTHEFPMMKNQHDRVLFYFGDNARLEGMKIISNYISQHPEYFEPCDSLAMKLSDNTGRPVDYAFVADEPKDETKGTSFNQIHANGVNAVIKQFIKTLPDSRSITDYKKLIEVIKSDSLLKNALIIYLENNYPKEIEKLGFRQDNIAFLSNSTGTPQFSPGMPATPGFAPVTPTPWEPFGPAWPQTNTPEKSEKLIATLDKSNNRAKFALKPGQVIHMTYDDGMQKSKLGTIKLQNDNLIEFTAHKTSYQDEYIANSYFFFHPIGEKTLMIDYRHNEGQALYIDCSDLKSSQTLTITEIPKA